MGLIGLMSNPPQVEDRRERAVNAQVDMSLWATAN